MVFPLLKETSKGHEEFKSYQDTASKHGHSLKPGIYDDGTTKDLTFIEYDAESERGTVYTKASDSSNQKKPIDPKVLFDFI